MVTIVSYLDLSFESLEWDARQRVHGWKLESAHREGLKDKATRDIARYASSFDDIEDLDEAEEALACAIAYEYATHDFSRSIMSIIIHAEAEIVEHAMGDADEPLSTVASFLEKTLEVWGE